MVVESAAEACGVPRAGPRRVRLLGRLREDIQVVFDKDPAATSRLEVLLYPHLHALWLHRLAHALYRHRRRTPARFLALLGRLVSGGIDIHPGAQVGRRLFIDHGAGVVIGETAVIGDDVMLYHLVTLGSSGWWRDIELPRGTRRHPVVGDHVVLGVGVSILGPVTVREHSVVGAHTVVLTDLPAGSRIPAGLVVEATGTRATRQRVPADDLAERRAATLTPPTGRT